MEPDSVQLIQVPPHRGGRDLQAGGKSLDADHALPANQFAQIVEAPWRQLFVITVQHGLIDLERI
jgi:hypothetical protein